MQRLADGDAGRREEGVRDAAADHELVHPGNEALEHLELGRDLGTADDRDQRPLRLLERALERVELAREQRSRAGDGRRERDAVRAGLGAVRRAEGVHDEDVAQRRHALRERRVVLLLAFQEADVLEQHGLARLRGHALEPVGMEPNGPAEQAREHLRDRARARAPDRARLPSAGRDGTSG